MGNGKAHDGSYFSDEVIYGSYDVLCVLRWGPCEVFVRRFFLGNHRNVFLAVDAVARHGSHLIGVNALEGMVYCMVRGGVRFLLRLPLTWALKFSNSLWIKLDPDIVQLFESFFAWVEESIVDNLSISSCFVRWSSVDLHGENPL